MNACELCGILHNLPEDIIMTKIIPYSYNCQSAVLCQDIRSFYITMNYLEFVYNNRYRFLGANEMWLQWLKNDISMFMNKNIPTIHGYTDECLPKYKRHFMLKDKSNKYIREFVWYICNKCDTNVSIKINVGLLEPDERSQMMHFFSLII